MSDETTPKAPVRRWMRVLLFVSLAANLLVVGLVAGVVLKGPPERRDTARTDLALPYTRALGENDRKSVRRKLRKAFLASREEGGALAEDYVTAVAVLRGVPFDAEQMAALMARQSEGARKRMEDGQMVLIAVFAEMSDAERAAYADRLEGELTKLRERGKAWRPRPPKPDRHD